MTVAARHFTRQDAARNYSRVLDAAREAFAEQGAHAAMDDIAARAGVGVGTVYRQFANKDALIDELMRLALADLLSEVEAALGESDGLPRLLTAFGRSFSDHARYAELLLARDVDPQAVTRIRSAVAELTRRAKRSGTLAATTTVADVMALISALRGLIQSPVQGGPVDWQRFLQVHLAGLQASGGQRAALRS